MDSCEFESHCKLLVLDTSSSNIWQIGKSSKFFSDSFTSYLSTLVTDTLYPYPAKNHSYFDILIPNHRGSNLIVSFLHQFQTDTLIDGGYIEISYDSGKTWNNVVYEEEVHQPEVFATENLYAEQDTVAGGIPRFSGKSNGWVYTRIQWVWFFYLDFNPPDTLHMRFHFISDSMQTNKAGWMIDKILVSIAELPFSVDEINSGNPFIKIEPNPVEDVATIEFEHYPTEVLSLEIYNALGQKIKIIEDIRSCQIQFYKDNLTGGIYYVQLKNMDQVIGTTKLVIK